MDADGALEDTGTRRRFLRQAGMTLAAAIGFALLPRRAEAACCSCCKSSSCPTCSGTPVRYKCACGGVSCCICHDDVGNCFGSQICYC
jgi:hypothetical protein